MSWDEYELCSYSTPKRPRVVPDVRLVTYQVHSAWYCWILLSTPFVARSGLQPGVRVRLFRGHLGAEQGQVQIRVDDGGPLVISHPSGRHGSKSVLGGILKIRSEFLGVNTAIEQQAAHARIEAPGVVSFVLPRAFVAKPGAAKGQAA